MNQINPMKQINLIKRIYSTGIGLHPGGLGIPRGLGFAPFPPQCMWCKHFCPHGSVCKKFSCPSIIARANPFKCGIFGAHFKPIKSRY